MLKARDDVDLFLKHGPIIGHVQHQLDLLLLLELGGGAVIGPVYLHLAPPALDLVAGPWLQGDEVMHLGRCNNY